MGNKKEQMKRGTMILSKFRTYELNRESASLSDDPPSYKEEREELLELLKYFEDLESLENTLALTSADDYETCRILGEYNRMQALRERTKRKDEKDKKDRDSLLSY